MSRFVHKRIYGRGLGGIFRGVYKFFRPLLSFLVPTIKKAVKSKTGRKLIKQAKKSALKAGVKTLSDVSSGENVSESMTKNLKKATADVLKKLKAGVKLQNQKRATTKKRKTIIFFIEGMSVCWIIIYND